jgi:transposase
MVGRGELTDAAWAQIAPLLPIARRRGKQWSDHRRVINGILWKIRTGAPWRDLPERYGPWQTCYDRFVRWRRDGTWDRLLAHAQTKSDAVGEVIWEVSLDSTVARAHQHAAGARRRPSQADQKKGSSTRPTKRLGAAEAASRPSST